MFIFYFLLIFVYISSIIQEQDGKLEEFLEFTKKYNKEYQTKEDYSLIVLQLKSLAIKLGIPIMVLSQLKRNLEYRADKRPLCCDIRGYARNQNAEDSRTAGNGLKRPVYG